MSVEPDGTTMDDVDNLQALDHHVRLLDEITELEAEVERLTIERNEFEQSNIKMCAERAAARKLVQAMRDELAESRRGR